MGFKIFKTLQVRGLNLPIQIRSQEKYYYIQN